MDKTELLDALRSTHARIESAVDALDDEALLAPAPTLDGWTRKDVLAHVEWCNRYAAAVLELRGGPPKLVRMKTFSGRLPGLRPLVS